MQVHITKKAALDSLAADFLLEQAHDLLEAPADVLLGHLLCEVSSHKLNLSFPNRLTFLFASGFFRLCLLLSCNARFFFSTLCVSSF